MKPLFLLAAVSLSLSLCTVSEAQLFGRRRGNVNTDAYRCKVCGKQHARDGFLSPRTWLTFCHKCGKQDCKQHQKHRDASWDPKAKKHWMNLDAVPAPSEVIEAAPTTATQPEAVAVQKQRNSFTVGRRGLFGRRFR